ncbi:MAG TPA: patatin-like phospholipase family protein, partial [Ilumatobacteraceae bacterium]|nr:patatin-like phospholipase family protein [Ilumatobacteraceae bacterium]
MDAAPRVALALGSGGARGYAHIGVIQVLREQGYEIAGVAGSSMGALVGGLYAVGRLDDFTDWALGLTRFDVLRLMDVSFTAPGAIRAEKILNRVRDLAEGVLIEDLPIPYTAVASDLGARKAVWFQRGPLDVAIRASIAIPGVFAPVMLNGRILVDGGAMDPVPMLALAAIRADFTIAVDLGGLRSPVTDEPLEVSGESRPMEEWADKLKRTASNLFDRDLVRSLMSRLDRGRDSADDTINDSASDSINDSAGDSGDKLGSEIEDVDVGITDKIADLRVHERDHEPLAVFE